MTAIYLLLSLTAYSQISEKDAMILIEKKYNSCIKTPGTKKISISQNDIKKYAAKNNHLEKLEKRKKEIQALAKDTDMLIKMAEKGNQADKEKVINTLRRRKTKLLTRRIKVAEELFWDDMRSKYLVTLKNDPKYSKLGNAILKKGADSYFIFNCKKQFYENVKSIWKNINSSMVNLGENYIDLEGLKDEEKANCKAFKEFKISRGIYISSNKRLDKYTIPWHTYPYYKMTKDLEKFKRSHYTINDNGYVFKYKLFSCDEKDHK